HLPAPFNPLHLVPTPLTSQYQLLKNPKSHNQHLQTQNPILHLLQQHTLNTPPLPTTPKLIHPSLVHFLT
ncbi:hypothetical protein, partial [Bacillus sp. WP8]|uniref:hypothetical protein n=1 Tax=Bacillus sp. WP8 TaxID=756828 RepID=UPI001C92C7D1